MRLSWFPEAIERARVLDRPAKALTAVVGRAVPHGPVKDLLSGTWLGHPLHPLLTDLPIGFWTSAWLLDAVGGNRSARAARTLVGAGVLAAVPTAVAGASDWGDTTGGQRRVGLVHAAANSVALACFATSYVHRLRGRRAKGILWSWLGTGAATVGGHLGGHLVNALGVGVDTTTFNDGLEDWTAAGPASALVEGRPVAVQAGEVSVLVVRDGDRLLAMADRCTHRGGPLHEGDLVTGGVPGVGGRNAGVGGVNGCVECPWHQSRFRLEDGAIEAGPATFPQPRYEVRVRGDALEVRAAAGVARRG